MKQVADKVAASVAEELQADTAVLVDPAVRGAAPTAARVAVRVAGMVAARVEAARVVALAMAVVLGRGGEEAREAREASSVGRWVGRWVGSLTLGGKLDVPKINKEYHRNCSGSRLGEKDIKDAKTSGMRIH